jgi:hypothetical protein
MPVVPYVDYVRVAEVEDSIAIELGQRQLDERGEASAVTICAGFRCTPRFLSELAELAQRRVREYEERTGRAARPQLVVARPTGGQYP